MECKKVFAFSLIEITIALVIVAVISASLAPVMSKRLTTKNIKKKSTSELYVKCTNINNDCRVCDKTTCFLCDKTCASGELDVATCTCK